MSSHSLRFHKILWGVDRVFPREKSNIFLFALRSASAAPARAQQGRPLSFRLIKINGEQKLKKIKKIKIPLDKGERICYPNCISTTNTVGTGGTAVQFREHKRRGLRMPLIFFGLIIIVLAALIAAAALSGH